MINSKWLVYSLKIIDNDVYYHRVLHNNYEKRLKLPGRRDIIKINLSFEESTNFVNILNKLKK